MIRVVFVCTANRCRSPIAQGILSAKWEATGKLDGVAASMGIHGMDAQPPTDFAVKVCAENGIDISKIRSRAIISDELRTADLIFAMEPFHKEFLRIFFPDCSDRLFLLGTYPDRKESKKYSIKDPVGGSFKDYRKTFESLASHIDRIMPFLQAEY